MSKVVAEVKEAKEDTGAKKVKHDFEEFLKEFKNESDRAAVILGASKLDQLLAMLLEKYLLPCPNSNDQLFSGNGPFGTFSAKIDMCYRLGIIDAQFTKNIHLIRRIRNEFAHEIYGAKLSGGPHKDRVKALISPVKEHEWFKMLKEEYFEGVEDTRASFSSAIGLMIVRLDSNLRNVNTVNSDEARGILPKT